MKRKGFTLVEIMIVVAIVVLLALIVIPNILRPRVTANELTAQATLRTISSAFEKYAAAHNGNYPTTMTDLTSQTPPYLNEDYVAKGPRQGYIFTVPAYGANYCIQATPETSGQSKTFNIKSGGVLSEGAC